MAFCCAGALDQMHLADHGSQEVISAICNARRHFRYRVSGHISESTHWQHNVVACESAVSPKLARVYVRKTDVNINRTSGAGARVEHSELKGPVCVCMHVRQRGYHSGTAAMLVNSWCHRVLASGAQSAGCNGAKSACQV